jgi:hypothetical protein
VIVHAMACGAPKSVGHRSDDCFEPAVQSVKPRIELAYIRDKPCKNWSSALEIAKRISGCGPWGTRVTCPKCSLPCNICRFIEDGHLPEAYIVSHINGSIGPISAVAVPEGSTAGMKVALFRNWLCELPQYRDTLAQAMLHEAIHLCKYVAPATPTMNDGPLREYLGINPWPYPKDTKDLVDECWENR